MKTIVCFLIIAFSALLAFKIAGYFRYVKLHEKQLEQLTDLVAELKIKQAIYNQKVKAMQMSESYQKTKMQNMWLNISLSIDKFLSGEKQ